MAIKEYLLNIWPGSPVISVLVLILIATLVLYFARRPVHRAIRTLSRVISNSMRLSSHSVMLAEDEVRQRNRDVLLAEGRDASERLMEREFRRVDEIVKRDLFGYPALHRSLMELINKIDEDYRESTQVPPSPPEWVDVIKSVAEIPASGDLVSNMLREVRRTLEKQEKTALGEYRKSTSQRHSLLTKMMPNWRNLSRSLSNVDKTITGMLKRTNLIDRQIEEFEEIRKGSEKALRTLSSSSLTQFFISGIVLLIAVGGAIINFNLIALPMSEMVGGASYIGPFKASNVAALVIILVEIVMGLFLMESLRITRLFPVIYSMDDRLRFKIMLFALALLVTLAGVESSLAFMRDQIATDLQALRQTLAGGEVLSPVTSWIPTVGQMVMGFILPFALTFVAIPFESFIHSSRTVLGVILAGLLRIIAFGLRLVGTLATSIADFIIGVYDLLIFPPLWIEEVVSGKWETYKRKEEKATTESLAETDSLIEEKEIGIEVIVNPGEEEEKTE